ncbi:SPOR domain-containing protein [Thiomicrorhabdus sp.]|uniref:SPOR domain-containing protein n=1 Tax=Thiomicrorhabdus sp. TaxID=2039724 RepID=UPI0029C7F8D9|nr:SPOR domain-containing protein [Thiomicrorhabdus sp.]
MSFTISDLEKEREKILKEIENKTQQFSQSATESPSRSQEPNLRDWLKAADTVVPDQKKVMPGKDFDLAENTVHPTSESHSLQIRRKNVAYGIAILSGTVVFTLAASLFFSHQDLQTQLNVMQQQAQTQSELIQGLEEKIAGFEKQDENVVDVDSLKVQLSALEHQIADLESQIADQKKQTSESDQHKTLAALENLVNQKWQLMSQQLAQQTKLGLKADKAPAIETTSKTAKTADLSIKEPTVPSTPKSPQTPKVAQSPAQTWLLNQNGKDYILQLASSTKKSDLQRIVDNKKIKQVEILPQTTKQGGVRYILVSRQAFEEKALASDAAKKMKTNFGISPWIRQFEDLSRRLPG